MEENKSAESDQLIRYRFADREEGRSLIVSNTDYFNGFSGNDLQFRLQSKDATMEEYLSFASDQVEDFSDEHKALIEECFDRIEKTIADKGYELPALDEITLICTTMREECGSKAYTHGTQIYIRKSYLDSCTGKDELEPYLLYMTAHELFHCLTRCDPDFRADMYKLIHFTVQEEEYKLPPSVQEFYISNPDVEHHNAYATFEIDGNPADCYMAYITKKHFEKEGDMFFDSGTAVMVPVDGTDMYYFPEDASNFDEVFGRNTSYTIDPEECMNTILSRWSNEQAGA